MATNVDHKGKKCLVICFLNLGILFSFATAGCPLPRFLGGFHQYVRTQVTCCLDFFSCSLRKNNYFIQMNMSENHYSQRDSKKQSFHLPLQILGRKAEWALGEILPDCTAHSVVSKNVYLSSQTEIIKL